ncbi:MAG: TRAP transporter small permease [Synergistaceae bacterium]|jgi:TRAP-type C4-dicarboxylate transport system permease small subunit|nr:TRAP transporter small permease [Synergistaceae bacterium]
MLKEIWDHLEEIFLIPSLIFSVGLIFMQIIMRYVFGSSLSWSEELARYLFIWEIWIGISYAARNRSHLRILLVKQRLGKRAQDVLEIAVTVVWAGFALFIAVQGFSLVMTIGRFGQKSSALQLPMVYPHLAVPVGCALMAVRLIENTVKDFISRPKRGGTE